MRTVICLAFCRSHTANSSVFSFDNVGIVAGARTSGKPGRLAQHTLANRQCDITLELSQV